MKSFTFDFRVWPDRPIIRTFLCAPLLIAISSLAFAQATPDVIGISVGMPAERAIQIIDRHVAQYGDYGSSDSVGVVGANKLGGKDPDPYVHTLRVSARPNFAFKSRKPVSPSIKGIAYDAVTVYLSPPPSSKVVAIDRQLNLDPSAAIMLESVLQQMRSKYGSELKGQYLRWFFEAGGGATKPPQIANKPRTCHADDAIKLWGRYGSEFPSNLSKGSGHEWAQPGCNRVYQLFSTELTSGGQTANIRTTLIDYPSYVNAIVDGNDYLAKQSEAERAEQEGRASKRTLPKF